VRIDLASAWIGLSAVVVAVADQIAIDARALLGKMYSLQPTARATQQKHLPVQPELHLRFDSPLLLP
jgi:hypothetical protein